MSRNWHGLTALLVVSLLWSTPASADQTDYLPDNLEWNGLSELTDLAHGHQVHLELVEELNWKAIPPDSTLLVIYPLTELKTEDLFHFLRGGGKLLLADDHGNSEALLKSFGILRHAGSTIRSDQYHANNPNLPVASAGPARHSINTGVSEVVANHPSFFTSSFPTLVGFNGGKQQLLVAGKLGEGRFVALSDPSVLINAMLRFQGNMTLANNLLRYLKPAEADRIFVLTRHFRVLGVPHAAEERESAARGVQRFLTEYSSFLARINNWAPKEATFRVLAIIGGGLALAALILLLPLPRRSLWGHWIRPRSGSGALGDPFELMQEQRLGEAGVAAAVLREEVEEILTEELDAPGPIFTVHPKWVIQRVRHRAGEEAAALCSRLLSSMKHVPHSVSLVASLGGTKHRDLAHMYRLSHELLKLLGRDLLPDVTAPSTSREDDHGYHR